jgi:hypothetical protein
MTWASILEALGSFFDPGFSYGLGWWSAIGCFVISLTVAKAIANQPRLSAVLALFSGAWVLVSLAIWARLKFPDPNPTHELSVLSDRAVDMASFLFVFTGCALAREAGPSHWSNWYQKWAQVAALSLMFIQMLPENAPFKNQLTPTQQDLFFGELLGILGFACLALGVAAVGSNWLLTCTVAVLVFYEAFSIIRTYELLTVEGSRPFIAWWLAYLFILARFALTGLLCLAVWRYYEKVQKEELRKQFEAEKLSALPGGVRP